MKTSFKENWKNKISFQKETNLYRVEPIVLSTVCWNDISEVSDMEKARPLHFNELQGKKLYAKVVRVEDKPYWKMYIKEVSRISVVYLQAATLNPVGKQ